MQGDKKTLFDIRDGRAMVSLGPLSPKKYCTFSCPFCYVHADFSSYESFTPSQIFDWLNSKESSSFDIVYVSGDTDSFAPPRTLEGLELLECLIKLKKDILFTTRMVFNDNHLDRLESLAEQGAKNGNLIIGCTSIAQLEQPYLEPKPIPPPYLRIKQLSDLHDRGIVSVLAMRPFLPVVPLTEYENLLDLAIGKADIVLGEVWYADQAGKLEQKVLGGKLQNYVQKKMDFDSNESIWHVYMADDVREMCEQWSLSTGIPFFMRSKQAIEWIRNSLSINSIQKRVK